MPTRPLTHRPIRLRPIRHRPIQTDRQVTRTFATNSATWRAIRAAHLGNEPTCRNCQQLHRLRAASVVDHIDGDSTNNHPDNLQSLCAPCHSSKTARQDGGFGNLVKRTATPVA